MRDDRCICLSISVAIDRECTGEGVRRVAQEEEQEGVVRDWCFTLEEGREGESRLGDATWTRDLWLIPRQELAGAFGSFPDEPGGQRGGGGGGGLARTRTNLALLSLAAPVVCCCCCCCLFLPPSCAAIRELNFNLVWIF